LSAPDHEHSPTRVVMQAASVTGPAAWTTQPSSSRVARVRHLLRCLSWGLLAPLYLAGGAGATTGILELYTGSFAASGTILEGPNAYSHQVRCRFAATRQAATSLSLRGRCQAYLIFSRLVSVDIELDPQSDRVTGTYTGSRVGTARLAGRKIGSDLDLTITWPTPLYGDTIARLKVANLAPDRFRIVVMDRIGVDGPDRATTDLTLVRL
jgi:hypothetical protein